MYKLNMIMVVLGNNIINVENHRDGSIPTILSE